MIGENPREMRTPMRRVRGLGSARSGTGHFWHMRLTSVALVPLTIAFITIVVGLVNAPHAAVLITLSLPLVAIVVFMFVIASVYHMWLGMQDIILDYVHDDLPKLVLLMSSTFFCVAIAAAASFAVLKIALGV